jgi:hypothetical protein
MENFFEELKSILNTEEGKRGLEEFRFKIEREEAHNNRWVDRVWNHIHLDINGSIDRILMWYESDTYRNREYAMCYEPRETLLWVLYDVAEKYGNECTEDEIRKFANSFTGGMRRIGSYVIQVMVGQGSVIKIDKI